MYVVALNGSSRRYNSFSMLILEPYLQGLHESKASVDLIHLTDLDINPCRGCLECWFKSPGKCTINDDMKIIFNKLKEADLWVFSTDIELGGASSLLGIVMDRLKPLLEPYLENEEELSRNRLRSDTRPAKIILVASCAYWEMENFDIITAQIESFSKKIGGTFAGALLRPHAVALPHRMWLGKETDYILTAARNLGKQMARTGETNSDLVNRLSSPLMLKKAYIRHLNQAAKKGLSIAAEGKRKAVEDVLKIKVVSSPFRFKKSQDQKLNIKIVEAINLMGGNDLHAESRYQGSITQLRKDADRIIPIIAAEYNDLEEARYLDRWSLVYLMGELQHKSALDVLDNIIKTPLPEEKSKIVHEYSTRAEELIIRTTAVEAIKNIAIADKNEEPLRLLLNLTRHELFSIRRTAVQGYLEAGGPDAEEKLKQILKDENKFLLTIKHKDIRQVSQAKIFDIDLDKREIIKPPCRASEMPSEEKNQIPDSPKTMNLSDEDKPCCN